MPPGQREVPALRVKHYGPVPKADPETWSVHVTGATADGESHALLVPELAGLDQVTVIADLHCASGWTKAGNVWRGVPAAALLDLHPPTADTVSVLAYAQYGYSASIALDDLRRPTTLLATHLDDEPLTPEHGFPVRLVVPHLYGYKSAKWFRGWEFHRGPRRGFWEERGYHLRGDVWAEERYSYQE